jgi:hypothetical protein
VLRKLRLSSFREGRGGLGDQNVKSFRQFDQRSRLPEKSRAAWEREPDIAVLIVALIAGGTMICAALIAPILLAAVTEMTRPPSVTYQQCGALKQDPNRLACYDRVLRQISIRSAKGVHPMVLGEILAEQPGPQ